MSKKYQFTADDAAVADKDVTTASNGLSKTLEDKGYTVVENPFLSASNSTEYLVYPKGTTVAQVNSKTSPAHVMSVNIDSESSPPTMTCDFGTSKDAVVFEQLADKAAQENSGVALKLERRTGK